MTPRSILACSVHACWCSLVLPTDAVTKRSSTSNAVGPCRKRDAIPSVPGTQTSELVDESAGPCQASHEENGIARLYLAFDMPLPAKGLLFSSAGGRDPCQRTSTYIPTWREEFCHQQLY